MGQIEDLRLFVNVIDQGSISKAAEYLGIAKSAVSRRLSLLEDKYHARLIDRRPGTWAVTQAGNELYQRALHSISDLEELDADFANASTNLSGPLSVSVPRDFGLNFLKGALVRFSHENPQIALTIDFDDRVIDLDRENYDFAFRISGASISGFSSRKIGTVSHSLYASPSYLDANNAPLELDDLKRHRLLNYGSVKRASWDFEEARGTQRSVKFQPFLNSNSGLFLLQAAIDGLGIARLPDFIANDARRDGDLIPILIDAKTHDWGIHLISSERRRINRRMRLFLEEMTKACMSVERTNV